jgi:hypothetical protein
MTTSPEDIQARLDAISGQLDECRAAAATVADGDPDALVDLSRAIDVLAADVAELKASVRPPQLGG